MRTIPLPGISEKIDNFDGIPKRADDFLASNKIDFAARPKADPLTGTAARTV
jgi:hypothetical protein